MQAAGADNADSCQPPGFAPLRIAGATPRETSTATTIRRPEALLSRRGRRVAAASMNTVDCARAISSGKWKGGVNPGARGLLTSLQAACSNLPSPGASPAPAKPVEHCGRRDGARSHLHAPGVGRQPGRREPPPRATGWWSRNHRRRCTEASSRRLGAPGSPHRPQPPSPPHGARGGRIAPAPASQPVNAWP